MNGNDQLTLNQLHRIVTASIKENDKRWKRIGPVVESYYNAKVIEKFQIKVWRGFVAILTVLAIIGSITSVIWAIFFRGN